VNVRFTMHVPPAITVDPFVQVFVPSKKSPVVPGVPEIVTAEAVPFVSVTGRGELCVPTNWPVVNVSGFGLTLTTGFEPAPDRVMLGRVLLVL
jgi:hypothetical protein